MVAGGDDSVTALHRSSELGRSLFLFGLARRSSEAAQPPLGSTLLLGRLQLCCTSVEGGSHEFVDIGRLTYNERQGEATEAAGRGLRNSQAQLRDLTEGGGVEALGGRSIGHFKYYGLNAGHVGPILCLVVLSSFDRVSWQVRMRAVSRRS